ncbi:hypothetical protein acdb102_05810 [Acidothermaceae bacterium B102]|nr:hypothetical protein acdb102_05810 [Acidothermaceae bacterium B102]
MTSWGEMTHLAGVRAECLPDPAEDGAHGLMERMRVMLGFAATPPCGHPGCPACNG